MEFVSPAEIGQHISRALGLHQAGQLEEAEKAYKLVLDLDQNQFEALHFLGLIEAQRGNFAEADRLMGRSLAVNTTTAEAYCNHARVLNALKRSDEALVACDRALAINQQSFEALTLRGNTLQDVDRFEAALASYNEALCIRPNYALALTNRANVLVKLLRLEEAICDYDAAITINSSLAEAWLGRGNAFRQLRRYDKAGTAYDRALAIKPKLAGAWLGRGNVFLDLARYDDALAAYAEALAINPNLAEVWASRGTALLEMRRFADAIAAFKQGLAIKDDLKFAAAACLHAKMNVCDWSDFDDECERLIAGINNGAMIVNPFVVLSLPISPADQLRCSTRYVQAEIAVTGRPGKGDPAARIVGHSVAGRARLKIAYVSADFHAHPTGLSFVDILERHDRGLFEIIGISLGPEDGSVARERIKKSLEQFHDVRTLSDADVAALIRNLGVHVAVDMAAHTFGHRAAILAHRPAPVQVHHLAAWTSGADFLDYIIADRHALPFDQQPNYSEKIVHLPDCCFQRDSTQPISDRTPTRAEVGLPEHAFVFCSFNTAYKINREMFTIWMRLLKDIEGSVLWLSQLNPEAVENLRREANACGVDAARLIFAPRIPSMADHLGRYRLADLFLDTLPYNAQTTASDALWAGLPVLTAWGRTYAGRLAASQLEVIGLPELATPTLADYEATALDLARDRYRLRDLRHRLKENRSTSALFDSQRLCRHTEAAFRTMWDLYRRGEAPRSFAVDPIGG